MAHSQSFRDLVVWKRSMDLVERIYMLSRRFPADERFGLTSQLRRATVSVPSNIGEGARRKKTKAFLNHLDIALGSQAEVEVQVEIARRLGYVSEPDYKKTQAEIEEIGRMLNGLFASLDTEDE